MEFLGKCQDLGVRNIEMESGYFAAFTGHLGIPAAVVCVTLLDRTQGDAIRSTPAQLEEFDQRPARVVIEWIRHKVRDMATQHHLEAQHLGDAKRRRTAVDTGD